MSHPARASPLASISRRVVGSTLTRCRAPNHLSWPNNPIRHAARRHDGFSCDPGSNRGASLSWPKNHIRSTICHSESATSWVIARKAKSQQRLGRMGVFGQHKHTREVAERETERLFHLDRVRDRQLGRAGRESPEPAHDQWLDKDWRPSYGDREIEMPDFRGGSCSLFAACRAFCRRKQHPHRDGLAGLVRMSARAPPFL